jgi:hypothetical protein
MRSGGLLNDTEDLARGMMAVSYTVLFENTPLNGRFEHASRNINFRCMPGTK